MTTPKVYTENKPLDWVKIFGQNKSSIIDSLRHLFPEFCHNLTPCIQSF